MKKSRLLGAVCACAISFTSTSSYAALVSADWKTTGDNLITRDDFGLEWLDLTETTSQNYYSIISQLGIGGQYEGWRYASLANISNLWVSAGADPNYFTGWSTQNNGVVANLVEFIGDTYCAQPGVCQPGEVGYAHGITGHGTPDGQVWTALASDRSSTLSETMDEFWLQNVFFPKSSAGGITLGSYLVRESTAVPLPPAFWLFGGGLLGLIGMARKNVHA